MELWFENYGLLSATRAPGFSGPGNITLTDLRTMHELYRWEEKGVEFAYYVQTMLAMDSVTREHYKKQQPEES